MKESIWNKEELWVARDTNGQIIRVSEESPEEMLQLAEDLKRKAN